jgi:predicted ATPase/DNA-binding NarL/FixJ family response regulator
MCAEPIVCATIWEMEAGVALIGRERELAKLEGMLAQARVLTVTGPGGCGKTRVAVELARRVHASDGRDYVLAELASVDTPEQITNALLGAVGARERFGRRPLDVLLERLARHPVLLVLDNCERVTPAVAALVEALQAATQPPQVLVTTREPLGIAAERVFQLGPLSVPDSGGGVGAVVRSDAGRLFVECASSCNPAFALTPATARAVGRICRELDGLPLAISLAASRLEELAAEEVADGLARRGRLSGASDDGVLPQHRSVRASLDWSYQLLGPREQALLRSLSAFAGGFTAAAAHAVAGTGGSEASTHTMLRALEAKSLIAKVEAGSRERWTLLQTVRDYAAEQLEAEGERERFADAHLTWFHSYASRADEVLLGPDGHAAIDAEASNLRLALGRALARDASIGLEMTASLMCHWLLGEHYEEGFAASSAALTGADDTMHTPSRAVVHCGAGVIRMLREEYAEALANTRTGLAIGSLTDDGAAEALCMQMSSMVLIPTGVDLEQGLRNAERAVELRRCSGDPLGLAFALANMAMASAICDRFDAVRAAYEELMSVPNAGEHARLQTWAEEAAAWAEVVAGSPARALQHADRALELEGPAPSMTHFQAASFRIHALARAGRSDEARAEGERTMRAALQSEALQAVPAIELALAVADLMGGELDQAEMRARRLLDVPQLHTLALVREVIGHISLAQADAHEAEAQAQELRAIAERSGSARHRAVAQFISGSAALLDGDSDRARDGLHAALAMHGELGLERDAADALGELSLLAIARGELERAARLAASAARARERLGCAAPAGFAERLTAAHSDLDGAADAWEKAWSEGSALELAEAISYARRGRGRRKRAGVGWGSLTPVELHVAQLVTGGLSNPQIASRLFIARSTVKMHLSSVYTKLNVANRTELAAAMAAHAQEPEQPREEDSSFFATADSV